MNKSELGEWIGAGIFTFVMFLILADISPVFPGGSLFFVFPYLPNDLMDLFK